MKKCHVGTFFNEDFLVSRASFVSFLRFLFLQKADVQNCFLRARALALDLTRHHQSSIIISREREREQKRELRETRKKEGGFSAPFVGRRRVILRLLLFLEEER